MILPPFIAFGISMMHRALGTGMDATLWIEMDSDKIGKAFGRLKPNRFVSGPLLMDGIIKHASGDLSDVYDITGGGEAISSELEDKFNNFMSKHNSKARYMTGYGMSEFGSVVSLNWLKAYKKGSIGIPLPLTEVKIVNQDSEELQYNDVGELIISTPCAMLGYYKNDQATKEIVETDEKGKKWFHTGDLAYIDDQGFMFLVGRIKRIYTALDSNDVACKIFPQRIEELIMSNDTVAECGVVVRPDAKRRFVPIAFITLQQGYTNESVLGLKRICETELPEHMQPVEIIVLMEMPMTPSGKIDYQKLEGIANRPIGA